jgi:hypothetical protein
LSHSELQITETTETESVDMGAQLYNIVDFCCLRLMRHNLCVSVCCRYYRKSKAGCLQNVPYVDNSWKWAGGGFLSTVGDLLRFGNAMMYSYQWRSELVGGYANLNLTSCAFLVVHFPDMLNAFNFLYRFVDVTIESLDDVGRSWHHYMGLNSHHEH